MQQRYYDPVAGRFLSIDPVTTDANTGGSFNRYAYANNNPYKYIDPDGRNPLCALSMPQLMVLQLDSVLLDLALRLARQSLRQHTSRPWQVAPRGVSIAFQGHIPVRVKNMLGQRTILISAKQIRAMAVTETQQKSLIPTIRLTRTREEERSNRQLMIRWRGKPRQSSE
jgi:hypothetical protein